jgi:hypothetical protein
VLPLPSPVPISSQRIPGAPRGMQSKSASRKSRIIGRWRLKSTPPAPRGRARPGARVGGPPSGPRASGRSSAAGGAQPPARRAGGCDRRRQIACAARRRPFPRTAGRRPPDRPPVRGRAPARAPPAAPTARNETPARPARFDGRAVVPGRRGMGRRSGRPRGGKQRRQFVHRGGSRIGALAGPAQRAGITGGPEKIPIRLRLCCSRRSCPCTRNREKSGPRELCGAALRSQRQPSPNPEGPPLADPGPRPRTGNGGTEGPDQPSRGCPYALGCCLADGLNE